MKIPRGTHNVREHVLVAAVTAAERGEQMPTTATLAAEIGCQPHGITMAVISLEKRGAIKRINDGGRRRLLICRTGAATAETTP